MYCTRRLLITKVIIHCWWSFGSESSAQWSFCSLGNSNRAYGRDFGGKNSLNSLRFSLMRETNSKKKIMSNFANLQFSNFCISVNFITQEWKFFKIAQLFLVSVSLVRENMREWIYFFHKIPTYCSIGCRSFG